MRPLLTGAAAAAAFFLAACDGGAETPKTEGGELAVAVPGSDRLKAMTEQGRNLGFYRAVRDGGQSCKRVEASAYQQQYKNMAMWVVRCNTGLFAVFIAPNDDVQVRQCRHAQQLGLPECRPLDGEPAAAPVAPAEG